MYPTDRELILWLDGRRDQAAEALSRRLSLPYSRATCILMDTQEQLEAWEQGKASAPKLQCDLD